MSLCKNLVFFALTNIYSWRDIVSFERILYFVTFFNTELTLHEKSFAMPGLVGTLVFNGPK